MFTFLVPVLRIKTFAEILRAIGALALAVGSLRTPYSGLVTCSDASLHGAGLCASAGLTQEGVAMLRSLDAGEANHFRPAGAMTTNWGEGPRILVISLFDGVGALMAALTRLKCRVVGYVSCEIDKECKRITRRRWPGVMEFGDVTKVDAAKIELLHHAFGRDLDVVLVGAGSPCQDLSSLLAGRKGLAGDRSKLFFEIPRIIKLLTTEFAVPVHFFVENVFGMDQTNRREFSRALGCKPLLIDAKWFSWCRRPRLWWCSWTPSTQAGENLLEHEDYMEWIFPIVRGGINKLA